MIFSKNDLTLNDTSIDMFRYDDVAYFTISKELTDRFFSESRIIPRDNCGNENDHYVSGEIQILFNRSEQAFSEALIAPVYEEDGGAVSGDIYHIDDMVTEDIISMAKDILFKGVSDGED